MPRKGFPQISSMPTIRVENAENSPRRSENIPMRSIEVANLQSMPSTSSPYSKRSTDFTMNAGRWTPISISSESSDEDEKRDVVDDAELRGEFYDRPRLIRFLIKLLKQTKL